jgi:hypothetical protein
MSGQIVDASLVAAPRQRNTEGEKKAIQGRAHPTESTASEGSCVQYTTLGELDFLIAGLLQAIAPPRSSNMQSRSGQ